MSRSRDNYWRQRRPKDKIKAQQLDGWGAIELLIYELKPILYTVFAIAILRTDYTSIMWIKVSSLGILAFAAYIALSRLTYRGHI
jgi:hypothetical protein